MQTHYDLIVVGGGPGGMAAAVSARRAGLSVLVTNEQGHLGGQIYHSIETTAPDKARLLGKDYQYGKGLVSDFKACGADHLPQTLVASMEAGGNLSCVTPDGPVALEAGYTIVAAGAMERPVPIPGWTLPGVMGAASVDILFKQSDVIPKGRVVFAGSGPLFLSVISHMIDCGVEIAAILDTSSLKQVFPALPHLPMALAQPDLMVKGLAFQAKIKRARIPVIKGIEEIRALGKERLEGVQYQRKGQTTELAADLLLLHEGLIPNTQISRLLQCDHAWDAGQRYWKPVVDDWGQSSVPGTAFVGDCTGIAGAKAAEHAGHLAGLQAAHSLGFITREERDQKAAPHIRARIKNTRIRPFVEALYPPNVRFTLPRDPNTVICRCEDVRLGEIQAAMAKGCTTPVTLKNKTRAGMGRCQGRTCGPLVTEILAHAQNTSPEAIGYYKVRPLIKPLSLGELSRMDTPTQ